MRLSAMHILMSMHAMQLYLSFPSPTTTYLGQKKIRKKKVKKEKKRATRRLLHKTVVVQHQHQHQQQTAQVRRCQCAG